MTFSSPFVVTVLARDFSTSCTKENSAPVRYFHGVLRRILLRLQFTADMIGLEIPFESADFVLDELRLVILKKSWELLTHPVIVVDAAGLTRRLLSVAIKGDVPSHAQRINDTVRVFG